MNSIQRMKKLVEDYEPEKVFVDTPDRIRTRRIKAEKIADIPDRNGYVDPRGRKTKIAQSMGGLLNEEIGGNSFGTYPNPLEHNPANFESYDHDARKMVGGKELRIEYKSIGRNEGDLDIELKNNDKGYPCLKNQVDPRSTCDIIVFGYREKVNENEYRFIARYIVDGPTFRGFLQDSKGEEGGSYFYMIGRARAEGFCIELNHKEKSEAA